MQIFRLAGERGASVIASVACFAQSSLQNRTQGSRQRQVTAAALAIAWVPV
jgi:hypothetical protein